MAQAKTQTLSLGHYWNDFISCRVNTARYSSASEIVRSGLRLLEENEANSQLEALREALREGEESEDAGEINMNDVLLQARKNIREFKN